MGTHGASEVGTKWYSVTNTLPWSSNCAVTIISATKHAMGVLKMNGGRKGEICEYIGQHVLNKASDNRDGSKLEEVPNVVVAYVDMFRLGDSRVVALVTSRSLKSDKMVYLSTKLSTKLSPGTFKTL